MESESKLKWWLNSIAAFIFILLCIIYLLIRPIIVQNLEPVLKEKAGERINGTLSWDMMDIDPNLDLSFTNLVLKDANGEDVLQSPSLTVGWSMSALFNYLLFHGGIADVVRDIHVETPDVHLSENSNGKWNVESILKPSSDTDNGTFTGRLLVQGGTAAVTLSDQNTYDFTGVNTTLAWDKEGKITGPFDGEVFQSHFNGDLNFTSTSKLEINMKTDPVSLKSLQPLLNEFPQVSQKLEVNNGTGEVTSAKIWKSDGTVAYHVKGHINDAALRYENDILADGAAFFDIENGEVSIKEASFRLNDQKFSGEGIIHIDESNPLFQGHMTLDQVDMASILSKEDIAGIVSGDVSFWGNTKDPYVSGNVVVIQGRYQNFQVSKGSVGFTYGDGQISIPYVKADAAGGHLEGRGFYNMSSGAFSADVTAENLSLDSLPISSSPSGVISGSASAQGTYHEGDFYVNKASFTGDGNQLSYQGASAGHISGFGTYHEGDWNGCAYGNDVSYDGISLDTISGMIASRHGVMQVDYLTGTSGEGAFTLNGSYGDTMDLKGEVSAFDLSLLSGVAGIDMAGQGSGAFHIMGTVDNPTGDGHITARNGHIGKANYESIDGKWALYDGKAHISSLMFKGPKGQHTLSGTIGIAAPHALQLQMKTEKARIEDLLSVADLSYPVTGWMENTMTIGGSIENPSISGDFLAWNGSVMGELFQSMSGEYSYNDKGITLNNGLAYIYDGAVVASGTLGNDAIHMDVSLHDIDIDKMLPNRGIHGKVNMIGKASGTMDNPMFDGTLSSRDIAIGGTHLYMISTGIHYGDHLVSLDDGAFRQQEGTFKWRGSYHTRSGKVQGVLSFNGWNIKEALKLFKLPSSAVDGTVQGGMRIGGTLDNPNVDFKAKVLGGHLGHTPIGEGHIDFSYMNQALSIRQFQIPVGNGMLAAEGSMNSQGDLDMQIAAKDMDVSWIPEVMEQKNMKVGGNLTAALTLSGNKEEPEADLSVTVDHPSYGDIEFDQFTLLANASHNVVTVQNALLNKGIYRASLKGTLPGNLFTGSKTDKAVPMDLDVNLDQADMNILGLFWKPVTAASGPIKGHVKIAGSYLDPMLLGGVSVSNGQVSLMTMEEPVSPIKLNLSFSGHEAELDGSAAFGKGLASIKGSLAWQDMAITHYDGEAHIHTPDINSTYFKGAIDGDFTLGEVFAKPGISGHLSIHDATVDVPLSLLSDSEDSSMNLLTKLDITIGDNVRLYNSALYDLMVKGNINMMGPLSAPIMTGRVNVDKGTVKINMSEFKVNEARAVWGGTPGSFLPVIYAKADTKVGHYAIEAELNGPPGDMKTTFHSEPALNDSQIVMLLTLHQDPTKDSSGAMEGALFNAGLTMAFGGSMQEFMKDTIGLDYISITSSLTDYYDNVDDNHTGYYYIKIGKYLFNDFMLTATMGVNNDDKSLGLHYDFNSHLGLSSWYNTNHDSYVGTDWSFKF